MLDRVRVMHNRIAQRLAAAAALLSLAAASAATSGVWLRCRITGVMQPACCCPAADGADHAAPSPATAEAADCCDRVVTDVEQAPSEVASRAPAVAPALVVGPADVLRAGSSIAASTVRLEIEQTRAGPPDTRARLLSKSAFLI